MQRKIQPSCLLIGFVFLYNREVHVRGYSNGVKTLRRFRSNIHSLSEVRGLSSYEENELNNLVVKTVKIFDEISQTAGASIQDAKNTVLPNVLHSVQTFSTPSEYLTALQKITIDRFNPSMGSILNDQILQAYSTETLAASSIILSISIFGLISVMNSSDNADKLDSPYPDGRYNVASAKKYFDRRRGQMLVRLIQIGSASSLFLFKILVDYLSKRLEENSEKRAKELSVLLTQLGPSFIKVGQSLSIRTDLLSPAYVKGLKALQDQVPPFPTSQAIKIIEEELRTPIQEIFVEFSDVPVAAASLGQVYKAKLKVDEREVAVKVQRPNIMNQVALDMHLLREIAPWAKNAFKLNTDLADVVDTWAVGFVDELDYISEAENAEFFTESIKATPLSGVVFAPPIIDECTTGKVLTTEWVVGERLDKSRNEDVTILCSIAMNSYLTMMLETGVLHCDPHPGNLLRTPDGRLCILDWGMITRLDPNLQITLIEHVAHLTSGDYAEVPRDLLVLGFIPQSKADLISDSGIVEVLADVYSAWTRGGGAASINVNQVIAQLQDLTAKKGNLFMLPAYFAYIAKAFSVLEGIGLSSNPKYSIVNECLPYVSKRLLTDNSERTGRALGSFVFGKEKNDIENRVIDYKRVKQLVTGFTSYSTSASGALLGTNQTRTELIDKLSEQIFDLLVTEEVTPLQNIVLEQIAKLALSNSRALYSELRERSGVLPTGRTVLGTVIDPMGLFRASPIVRMSDADLHTVDTTRKLVRLVQEQVEMQSSNELLDFKTLTRDEAQTLSTILLRKIWARRTGIIKTWNRLVLKLLQVTSGKLEKGNAFTETGAKI